MGSLYRRDQNGHHLNLDLLLVYLIALVSVVVFAIKAIRMAVSP